MTAKLKSACLLLPVLLLVGILSCQNGDFSADSKVDWAALERNDLAVIDLEDAIANVEDATVEKAMVMNPVFTRDGRFFRHPRYLSHRGSDLREILRDLDVMKEQMRQIRQFIRAHRECVKDPLEGLREANAGIIANANEQRKAILQALRNGEITREEAMQQLKQLSEATREAIRNNPASQPFLQAICECTTALFDNIRSVLNEDQQARWDQWVLTLDGPCF